MKVKFACKTTGQVYEFEAHDVEGMRKHSEYTEVLAEVEQPKEAPKSKAPSKS